MRNKLLPLPGTLTALRAGAAIAGDTQEIAAAWSRYAEEVRRHTSEASQALLRVRTLKETLEVQARLLRDTMQSFRDQSLRMAETASPDGDASAQCAEGSERRTNRGLASAVGMVAPIWRPKASTTMRVDFSPSAGRHAIKGAGGKCLTANAPDLQRGGHRHGLSQSPSAGPISQ